MNNARYSLCLCLLTLALAVAPASAVILRVKPDAPGPAHEGTSWATAFTSIQPALDAAQPGDEVWVAGGIYLEAATLSKPTVSLLGGFGGTETDREQRRPRAHSTILTSPPGSVVAPALTLTADADGSMVDGLAFRGSGTALACAANGAVLSRNVFFENVCGVSCSADAAVMVQDSLFTRNWGTVGAGLFASDADVTVMRCRFEENGPFNLIDDPAVSRGGAIWCQRGRMVVRDSLIARNLVQSFSSYPLFYAGRAYGGGIYCENAAVKLVNNTLVENTATGQAEGRGAGAYLTGCTGTVANNIFARNVSRYAFGAPEGDAPDGDIYFDTPLEVRSNLFFENRQPHPGLVGTKGNIGADPKLGPDDLHLLDGSPCINAGDDSLVRYTETDIDGAYRIMGQHVDIGADEYGNEPPRAGTVRFVKKDAPGLTHDGLSWNTAFVGVQEALDRSLPGDEVWVAAGTYAENVTLHTGTALYGGFAGTEAGREQRGGAAGIMDGGRKGSVVTIGPLAAHVTLDGFTVRNGSAPDGGGIHSEGNAVTITHNIVEDNRSVIQASTIASIAFGGGISFRGDGTISWNTIRNNVAYAGSTDGANYILPEARGGGLYAFGKVTVDHNIVTGNTAGASSYSPPGWVYTYGGGICAEWDVTLADNLVADNTAASGDPSHLVEHGVALGGGVAVFRGGSVVNNTIAHNVAVAFSPDRYDDAAGLFIDGAGFIVSNNIIAQNTSGVRHLQYPASPVNAFRNNDVSGNGTSNWSPESSEPKDPTGTLGNIAADPLFADRAAGNYRLLTGSPAIDAGENGDAFSSEDLSGGPRIIGAAVDLGAYESEPDVPRAWRVKADAPGPVHDGTFWETAFTTVQRALDAAGITDEVWVAAGTYPGSLTVNRPRIRMFGGFAGTENERAQRDPAAHPTILDAARKSRVLTLPAEASEMVLDGFILRNGYAGYYGVGGGILCEARGITITHNVFVANMGIDGGGIYAEAEDLNVAENLFQANEAYFSEDTPEADGGGICLHGGSAVVRANVFRDNSAQTQDQMGFPQFANTTIAYGGGLYYENARVEIRDNLFGRNDCIARPLASRPYSAGSGLFGTGGTAVIVNNTFVENKVTTFRGGTSGYYGVEGGALTLSEPLAGTVVANNILAFNETGYAQVNGSASFRHNDVFANAGGNYYLVTDPTGTLGNIAADPMFANRAGGDFHLASGSPVINAGDDAVTVPGETDLDGRPRLQGARVDMGAYEADAGLFAPSDVIAALRLAGGLSAANGEDLTRLNVVNPTTSGIDLLDAIRLARKAAGLEL